MAPRTAPPFRADHVGSLLRPPELARAREEFAAGRLGAGALREAEDRAVREAVAMQESVGLRVVTDGELRREQWQQDFIAGIGGISMGEVVPRSAGRTREGREVVYASHEVRVTGTLALDQTIFGGHFQFLASAAVTATPKLTIPSPSMVHTMNRPPASVYPDVAEFRADLAAVYAEQIRGLAGLGCSYLQLDDTMFAFLNDPAWRERLAAFGGDPRRQHEINVAVLNQALAGRPAGMTVAVHMCRGNYRSSWFSEGGYDFVAEAVFGQLDVDALFLEYDDERAGGFEPLRFVPDTVIVVLGLVTTKTGELESTDDLKRRIDQASRFVPLERLCLSPQCGFASTAEGNALTPGQQRAKLRLVAETAADVWG